MKEWGSSSGLIDYDLHTMGVVSDPLNEGFKPTDASATAAEVGPQTIRIPRNSQAARKVRKRTADLEARLP